MKKYFLFTVCILFYVHSYSQVTAAAQTNTSFTYTQMIDSMMYPLNKSGITTGILYDRVFPFAGLQSFNSLYGNPDTSGYDHFYQAYSEIYNAAYSKRNRMNDYRLDTLAKAIYYTTHVVPIGVLCYDINLIDTNSLANNWFYRGADSLLHDVAGRTGNPYKLRTVTVAAALSTDTLDYGTGSFQFKYYNGLFFTNKGITITSITADFGTGTQNITAGNTVTINYATGGTKAIKFVVTYRNGQSAITYSKVFIKANPAGMRFGQPVPPDETRNIADTKYGFQGYDEIGKRYNSGTYGIYYHRMYPGGLVERKIKKPILLVDGFDPTDDRKEKDIYGIYLQYTQNNNFGDEMRDKGYDIIILNFPTILAGSINITTPFGTYNYPVFRNEGGDYIERNAFLLVTLIENINAELAANSSAEKIVLVGPSMGGLITRYALKWMENNGKNHNTRLWISFDAPHKGANIPIGDQDFLNFFASKAGNKGAEEARDEQINSVAARQMLLHHYLGTYDMLNSLPIGAPNFRNRWQQTLDNLGYPTNLRKIALVNGAINGTVQGSPCQRVFDMETLLTYKNFFIKVNLTRVGKASVSFTGDYGNYCEVFNGWVYIWFNANGRSAAAPASSKSYDIVPGGYFNAQTEIINKGKGYDPLLGGYSFGVGTNTRFYYGQQTHSFIPIFSALGMDLTNKDLSASLYSRNLVCSGESPFDSYYGPQTNEEHITLTTANVAWLKK